VVTYHVKNMRYDLVGWDLAILLEEFASLERDSGYIFCIPSLVPTIWLLNRTAGHDERPQQLNSGCLACEKRLQEYDCSCVISVTVSITSTWTVAEDG